MHYSALFALAVAPLALAAPSPVTVPAELQRRVDKSGCFSSGISWAGDDNKAVARDFARRVCKGDLGGRDFNAHETRRAKGKIGGAFPGSFFPVVVDYRMTYEGNDAKRFMSEADCIRHLTWFVDNCAKGGHWSDGRWSYKGDPNIGDV